MLSRAKGKLFINCATVTPAIHVWVEQKCGAKAGAQSLEACMASSITQAREGTLYLMCGGKAEVFERAKPILEKLSASPALHRPGGQGRAGEGAGEHGHELPTPPRWPKAWRWRDALGLDLTMLREVFSQTGANSRVLQTDGEDMQNRDHACFFSAAHAAKDSGIALKLGKAQGLEPAARRSPPRNNTTG